MPSYSEKRKFRLVPFTYDTNNRNFQAGAWKNWPVNIDPKTKSITGHHEAASKFIDRGHHCFIEPYSSKAIGYLNTLEG